MGNFVIFFSVATTLNLWLLSKNDLGLLLVNPTLPISQISALIGFVLMSLSLTLTTKTKIVEKFFGHLDKTYTIHRYMGVFAFILILNHFVFLALSQPDLGDLIFYLNFSSLPFSLGVISILLLVFAFIFILFIRLPYQIWLYTHRFLGASFLFAGFHGLLVQSDTSYIWLRIWISLFFALGLVSAIYTIFFYKYISTKYVYYVQRKKILGSVVNLYLKPIGKKMSFQPGQFVYISFVNPKIGGELHPFSISSSPADKTLRISVSMTGDYTKSLRCSKKHDNVIIYGPHGNFASKFALQDKTKFIFIAGGIGITPFLSILRHYMHQITDKTIYLYYCFREPKNGVFVKELQKIASVSKINLIPWCTLEKSHLTVESIKNNIPDYKDFIYQICGPKMMMDSLKKQLIKNDIPPQNIISEEFKLN